MVCGADAEWQFSPRGREPVATFQIAALRGPSFLFHLQRGSSGFTKETFPAPLKALLEDPSIIKAGVAINTDATHMLNDNGVKMASTVDLRVLAVSKLVVTSSRTLAGLTACLLGRQLLKDTVRCSRWGSPRLSDEQRDYAIRDAVASALLYEAIHKNKDPITSVPSSPFDPAIGLKVRLYNASHSACVAVGHVVSDATAEAALRHWQSSVSVFCGRGGGGDGGGGGGAGGVAAVQGLHRMRTPQGCIPC
ncbi:Chain A, Structure Of Mouse Wrn Exonuclease Domain pdb/2E6M/A Chain A, Structure Of Mouse Werner Exonuclease Domain [Ectocarpus siliculosus]|uniref:3'-5' exonuclease n=1 Tax=Ectocarpus siliculosus TaxID=2880 RepID=D7FVB3_ECTSI|nr:Chain A, Structure Of Mouse Wrn Exonuclease Domain pdb/2E6M/A Chain A, Structure Of Mouse Werner Exonuclease Domain [Ectocarpus siliculosus]|eukprot:CBJ26285.1 Chain A, Structure Of Mouse Wrn Exonuclease Domain pdb/2E6M/A Chain A, Structure Of Mouse Werner Exonuclease Domain [Ectocarpus siliculosus]